MAVHKNMAITQDQKAHLAKDHRHFVYEGLTFAFQRGHELSNEFMRLEIQIAAVLVAFSAIFLGYVAAVSNLWMRSSFAAALFFLVASMALGLFHIKRRECSWDTVAKDRQLKFNKWLEAVAEEGGFDEARAYNMGISAGIKTVASPPLWSWILQSIFLGMAAVILFGLALVFLFSA